MGLLVCIVRLRLQLLQYPESLMERDCDHFHCTVRALMGNQETNRSGVQKKKISPRKNGTALAASAPLCSCWILIRYRNQRQLSTVKETRIGLTRLLNFLAGPIGTLNEGLKGLSSRMRRHSAIKQSIVEATRLLNPSAGLKRARGRGTR
jgi:hypothetical protein